MSQLMPTVNQMLTMSNSSDYYILLQMGEC
jgi:hypothetical protein